MPVMDFSELPLINTQNLFDRLEGQALLLTANNRLARRLADEYAHHQIQLGKKVWPTPEILPLNSWLRNRLELLTDLGQIRRHLLSELQEKTLWQDIVQHLGGNNYLMQASTISRSVSQAWQLRHQWQLPLDRIQQAGTTEADFLSACFIRFQKECDKNRWLSRAGLIDSVTKAIGQQLGTPSCVILSGFEDPNRQQQQLVQTLLDQQCDVFIHDNSLLGTRVFITESPDLHSELRAAANWCKQHLQQSIDKNIAVLVPNLNESRRQVENIFNQILHPEKKQPPPWHHKNLFNLSLGLPLADYPLVNHGLAYLNLLKQNFSLEELSTVLISPFLTASSIEQNQLQKLDARLRQFGRQQWRLNALLYYLDSHDDEQTEAYSGWKQKIQQLEQLKSATPKYQSAPQWSQFFVQVLNLAGWPGERTLDSHEFQQSERFQSLLSEFRQLHLVKNNLPLDEAIRLLQQMARETIFQVKTETAPVQIMGLLEAAGQQFDFCWIIGLDDETLPARPAPNPLLPVFLQREYDLPHCSPEREYRYASRLINLFSHSATEVVFSYSLMDGEKTLRPSPLIFALASEQLNLQTEAEPNAEAVTLEKIKDDKLPALPDESPVTGGTSILTQQANCPFQAAATHRLFADTLETPVEGVDPRDWGSQVHQVLELVWKKLRKQQKLQQLTDDELQQLITDIINNIFDSYTYKRPDLYSPQFTTLEKQHLHDLVFNWLQLEKQRKTAFEVVEQEQAKTLSIGGLILNTKADRVDQLEDGSNVIIDYKTGYSASSSSWTQDSITEPQLPLYSVNESQELSAVALAKLNDKKPAFNGVAQAKDILPGIKAFDDLAEAETFEDWQDLMQHWQNSLTQLAESFRLGNASVDPINCQYCSYGPLCRIHEMQDEEAS